MHFLKRFFSPPEELSADERMDIELSCYYKNISRIRIYNILFLIYNTIILFFDIQNLQTATSAHYNYFYYTFITDIVLEGILILYLFLTFLTYPPSMEKVTFRHKVISVSYAFVILFMGSFYSSLDQLYTGQITIYFLCVFGISATMYFNNLVMIPIYLISYLTFLGGILLLQKSADLVFQNINQGTLLMLICVFISRVLYSTFRTNLIKQKIIERQKIQIENEKNILKKRNEVIENELEMARRIQLQMIPASTPNANIVAFYKPMDRVGGDFYDFIQFPSGQIGVFLSDVSGHGVPAAFLTSMIKSITLQVAPVIDNPAEFIIYLNNTLYNQTDGNFITAFYGIVDWGNRLFTYANAGHNLPYLLTKDSIEQIPQKNRGIPLGILNNEEINQLDRQFQNHQISLPQHSKILLYTDGFVEATCDKNQDDFETALLNETLSKLHDTPPNLFIESLIERLVQFHGNNNFEDDVCLICIQTD